MSVFLEIHGEGETAFTYNESQIRLEELAMFARFPQGIPAHIDISQLH